jgi:hypothetical protein
MNRKEVIVNEIATRIPWNKNRFHLNTHKTSWLTILFHLIYLTYLVFTSSSLHLSIPYLTSPYFTVPHFHLCLYRTPLSLYLHSPYTTSTLLSLYTTLPLHHSPSTPLSLYTTLPLLSLYTTLPLHYSPSALLSLYSTLPLHYTHTITLSATPSLIFFTLYLFSSLTNSTPFTTSFTISFTFFSSPSSHHLTSLSIPSSSPSILIPSPSLPYIPIHRSIDQSNDLK